MICNRVVGSILLKLTNRASCFQSCCDSFLLRPSIPNTSNKRNWIEAMSLPFVADYDKIGKAKCKKCKQTMGKGLLRIGKMVSNPFGDGQMKSWHHLDCIFDTFLRARATTKTICVASDDIEGFEDLNSEDQATICKKVEEHVGAMNMKKTTPKKVPDKKKKDTEIPPIDPIPIKISSPKKAASKDDMFKEFRRLCKKIADVDSYLSKSQVVSTYLSKGTDGEKFQGDYKLWVRLLLPGVITRVYNLQSKQLLKLFSNIFGTNLDEMTEDLEKGDIAETIKTFFEKSKETPPTQKSALTLQAVDELLEKLSKETKEDAQIAVLKTITHQCTGGDLQMVVRLIKGDLRINAGAKHILDGVHSEAYGAFKATRNLDNVLDQLLTKSSEHPNVQASSSLGFTAKVMVPVQPMLAEACRSIEQAMKKCPNGMYAEIKYDGERVQVHKQDDTFRYYSRSLKPVMPHKVHHFKDYLPSAFPHGNDLILDSEVLLIDTNTGVPLPFGSLGAHKKNEFQDASVCLFVFDCIHYNGQDLMDRTIQERRSILEKNLVEIPNHVVLSEMKHVTKANQLSRMIDKVLQQGLEGLVLKDLKSIYEPGKRHWLKVKKDYLKGGAMADSADLVVLGAWFGTGRKGGMMSVFLMGCFNPYKKKWCTVTKVHTGFDDAALERLQSELKMVKISQNADSVPSWLICSKGLVPDFVAQDPKDSPVWEVTGAEFTQHDKHTADGISIRFPRVTKQRPDKNWQTATDLPRLKQLHDKSKEHTDVVGLRSDDDDDDDDEQPNSSHSPQKILQTDKLKQTTLSFTPDKQQNIKVKRDFDEKGQSAAKKIKHESRGSKSEYQSTTQFTSKPLPEIFSDIRLHIPDSIQDSSRLRRYFIAFGGTLVNEFRDDYTHQIVSQNIDDEGMKNVKQVKEQWLWDSIKLKALQPERFYKP